jgi:superfamily II DNA or RNA helicase
MQLRSYQLDCYNSIMQELSTCKSTLVVAATGTGKTVILGSVARDWPHRRVLIVAHRDELIRQAADKVGRICGEECAIEMGGERSNESALCRARVVVTSVQTMSRQRRQERFHPDEFGLIIIDEAHHATAESYLKVLGYFRANPNLKVLGVTATPDRADEAALGMVFESVAYEYEIRKAIDDGWLVPIQQQLVWVDGLDFSLCRTTAGDLNQGDLAKIMEAEKALHGVVYPTMKIAAGRKTLVFTASVAHAERCAEIANRHIAGCAEWISGETPMDERRAILKRYAKQDFQYLFNCAIALEGFDDPGIQVVAMARPTKSRALYSQAIGRGTRPLPGVPEPFNTPEERREAISLSAKPNMLVLDFVGNSGRHKLMHATDVLGCDYNEQELQEALDVIMEASKRGESIDVEEAFEQAQADAAERRELARHQKEAEQLAAEKFREAQALRLEEERKRAGIRAKADYGTKEIDAFSVFDITPQRERGWDTGKKPSVKMLATLRKAGFSESDLDAMSYSQAKQLLGEVFRRWDQGLCTLMQARLLQKYGYDTDIKVQEASKLIDAIKAAGWKRPPAMATNDIF